jgi:hypothetical protein
MTSHLHRPHPPRLRLHRSAEGPSRSRVRHRPGSRPGLRRHQGVSSPTYADRSAYHLLRMPGLMVAKLAAVVRKADLACRRLAELSRSVTRHHRRVWQARCPTGQTRQLSPGLRDAQQRYDAVIGTRPPNAPGRARLSLDGSRTRGLLLTREREARHPYPSAHDLGPGYGRGPASGPDSVTPAPSRIRTPEAISSDSGSRQGGISRPR